MLRYGPFAACAGIVAAARDTPALRRGHWNASVRVLQGALIDLGFKLPRSLRKNGTPDGIFGQETFDAVSRFQSDHGLTANGVAGRETIFELDRTMAAKVAPPVHIPVPPPVLPRTAHYELGSADPPMTPDKGAGGWKSRPQTATYTALKAAVFGVLPHATVIIGDDAVKHMAHYLGNSGSTYRIDLEGMMEEVPAARNALQAEAAQAQEFVEMLGTGKHAITSRTAEPDYNDKAESWNWYFAIGGYKSWGRGEATVQDGPKGRNYVLDFEYKFFDRYNWDKGKSVKIFDVTVTDEFMAQFHVQGLAREFDCVGAIRRRLSWRHGEEIAASQFSRSSGGRS
jgi:peptidoglycan hydrolase-like protein with peptidoglycan-binding domain